MQTKTPKQMKKAILIYQDLLSLGIDLPVGLKRLHPSSITSKQTMDS